MRSRLLTRHFLRRFLDNDLISPQADRHEALAMTCAALLSSTAFVSVLLSVKYLFRPLQFPGWTSIAALDDLFLLSGLSMVIMALVAVAVWDSLSLDGRDAAILGHLPVPRLALVRAQAQAVLLFALGFALALNAVPSVFAPVLRVQRLPIAFSDVLRMVGAHATVTLAAGLAGFLAVLGLRETLRALLGSTRLQRVSSTVQAGLVTVLATGFLLLPLSANVERRWLSSAQAWAVPPLWFVGLHDVLAGDVLDHLPPMRPPTHAPAYDRLLAFERRMTGAYRAQRTHLRQLAGTALAALGVLLIITAAASALNARRRLPLAAAAVRRQRWLQPAAQRLIEPVLARDALTRAGYRFALRTVSRSTPHRVVLATAAGIATAGTGLSLYDVSPEAASVRDHPLTLFSAQPMVLVILLLGYRQASRIPASVQAIPGFVLAWSGDERRFLEGVKRAGLLSLALPGVVVFLALEIWLMGIGPALAHAVMGVLLAVILADLLFRQPGRLPFVSSYTPAGNLVGLGFLYLTVTFIALQAYSALQRYALSDGERTLGLLAAHGLVCALAQAIIRCTPPRSEGFELDESLIWKAQRLGLRE